MRSSIKKSLRVNAEIIRVLSSAQISRVVGGSAPGRSVIYEHCESDPPVGSENCGGGGGGSGGSLYTEVACTLVTF